MFNAEEHGGNKLMLGHLVANAFMLQVWLIHFNIEVTLKLFAMHFLRDILVKETAYVCNKMSLHDFGFKWLYLTLSTDALFITPVLFLLFLHLPPFLPIIAYHCINITTLLYQFTINLCTVYTDSIKLSKRTTPLFLSSFLPAYLYETISALLLLKKKSYFFFFYYYLTSSNQITPIHLNLPKRMTQEITLSCSHSVHPASQAPATALSAQHHWK